MIDSEPTPQPPTFKDRKVGLILFGIVQLLIALGLLGMAGLQLLMIFVPAFLDAAEMGSPAPFAVTAALYVALAAGTAWLGIGSLQCRRWARALTLVLAWMGLVVGVLTAVFLLMILPSMAAQMKNQAGGEDGAVFFALGCMFVAVGLIYFIVPGAFVLFYRSPHVKATCEHHDPTPRWTDRYPLPVLAGGILLWSMAGFVLAPLMGTPLPLFGDLLTGPSAWVYAMVVGGLAAFLAWGYFRGERWAWLGALVLMAVNGASAFVTFRGDGLARLYDAMQVPAAQLEEMKAMGILDSVPGMVLVSTLVFVGFWLWLGRYFGTSPGAGPETNTR